PLAFVTSVTLPKSLRLSELLLTSLVSLVELASVPRSIFSLAPWCTDFSTCTERISWWPVWLSSPFSLTCHSPTITSIEGLPLSYPRQRPSFSFFHSP